MAEFLRGISYLRPHLGLRAAELNSRQKRNEVSTLMPELGLRDVPGDLVQRSRRSDRRIAAGVAGALPLVEASSSKVLAVAITPLGLLRRAQLSQALRGARSMATTYARVDGEPTAALAARALLRHAPIVIVSSEVDHFWRADPDCFSRASKPRCMHSELGDRGAKAWRKLVRGLTDRRHRRGQVQRCTRPERVQPARERLGCRARRDAALPRRARARPRLLPAVPRRLKSVLGISERGSCDQV